MYYLRNSVKLGSFANPVWANVPIKRRVQLNNDNTFLIFIIFNNLFFPIKPNEYYIRAINF